MSPAQAMMLIVTLSTLLAVVSALAGMLWWRVRSAPLVRASWLAKELADRQRALEALVDRLEKREKGTEAKPLSPTPAGPVAVAKRPRRVDRPEPTAIAGPTLIAVPDLASESTPNASDDLADRFGSIWNLADAGQTAEEIAQRMGQPIGQIELILGLRRRRPVAGGRP